MNTYNALVSAVLANVEDASDELINYLPFAIDLAHDRLDHDLDGTGLVKVQRTAMTTADPFVSRPSNELAPRFFAVQVSGRWQFLEKRTDEFVMDYWPEETSVGIPQYYADYDEYKFLVAPTPASAYRTRMSFNYSVSVLSSVYQTNYYTRKHRRPLLCATMVEVAQFMKNPTLKKEWEDLYGTALPGRLNMARRERRDDQATQGGPPENNTVDGAN